MTYNFPPEMPLTESFRGRHIFDPEKCKGCKLCARICPNKAIEMVERQSNGDKVLRPQIDYRKCCFCGLCVDVCPSKALVFSNFPMLVDLNKDKFVFTPEDLSKPPELEHGPPPKIKGAIEWARSRSLWIVHYMTGCCFIEAVPWVGSGFDMERFGLLARGSPRHSDVLIIGGYVTPKTLKRIIRIYEQMPNPKWVIALGNCPMSGGTYWDSYNTIMEIDRYIPIDIWIAGCPPRPEAIGLAIVHAMHAIQSGYPGKEEKVNKEQGLLEVPVHPLFREDVPPGEVRLAFGPCHPASGNFDLGLELEGEVVKKATPYPGYLHRGFEKLMEYRTWWQNIMLVPRICVLDGASYELGYVGVVEKLAGIDVPDRGKHLRILQAELSRIQSHLLNLGLLGAAAGLESIERITWGDREKILLLLEKLTGARIYQIYNTPGGVRHDIPTSFEKLAKETINYLRRRLEVYDDLLLNNETFIMRTRKVGVIAPDLVFDYDITGPNARGSGIEFDIRKAVPYEAYDKIEFDLVTSKGCDAYSRTLCRIGEIEQSLVIIENVLDQLPNGPIQDRKMANGKQLGPFSSIPAGEAIHCVESARGELCFHAISNGGSSPYRVKIRGPTFSTILVLLPDLLRGSYMADVPVVYWSLDQCPADHDR